MTTSRKRARIDEKAQLAREQFASELQAWRKETGFTTAYAFFHKCGGNKHFGFSYKHYLMIESGERLPSVDAMKAIAGALRGEQARLETRKRVLKQYLRALVEGEELFEPAFAESIDVKQILGERTPDEQLLSLVGRRKMRSAPRMSVDQYEVVVARPANFWVHEWLVGTGQRASVSTLAQSLNLSESDVSRALKELSGVGLLEQNGDVYYSSFVETDIFSPPDPREKERRPGAWKREFIDAKVPDNPSHWAYYYSMLAVSKEDRKLVQTLLGDIMREAFQKAYLLRPSKAVDDGELFLVELLSCSVLPIAKKR